MRTAVFAAIVITVLTFAPSAHARDFPCNPVSVASFGNRVHVKCAGGDGPIVFFALNTTNPGAASFTTIATAALVHNKSLLIVYDPNNNTGPSFGCALGNCRPASAIFVNK